MAKKKEKRSRKVGSAGRFGPRYGERIRKRVKAIEEEEKGNHFCPQCGAKSVHRVSAGVWKCERCEVKFTGGAYTPKGHKIKIPSRESAEEIEEIE
ncbi:hypothetical protein AKJ45_00660 [candidate division MSBL1 archaeon SCGC-AAA261F19]|uniref:Large ribosomal subunit protein eL43 n=1 Tax=candidate division MSBL1 archaeon SCGC-AAA261F19 TaxID=1698275 RepID=A0A133VBB4_9EURY|nr:hypothetical protein AKJ45_00660 [candidate division MSBL1 archaeon SCGC-AAA261F19]